MAISKSGLWMRGAVSLRPKPGVGWHLSTLYPRIDQANRPAHELGPYAGAVRSCARGAQGQEAPGQAEAAAERVCGHLCDRSRQAWQESLASTEVVTPRPQRDHPKRNRGEARGVPPVRELQGDARGHRSIQADISTAGPGQDRREPEGDGEDSAEETVMGEPLDRTPGADGPGDPCQRSAALARLGGLL